MSERNIEDTLSQIDALIDRRRLQQARVLLADALKQHPGDLRLLLQAAWTDYFDDQNDSALQTVRRILADDPDNFGARYLLLELHIERDALADAEEIAIDLLREYPENAQLYGRYANVMLRALKIDKAAALAAEGLRHKPQDSECLAASTLCDFIQHGGGKTSTALQKLLIEHPQSLRTLLLVTVALDERGDHRQAHQLAREMLRAHPDHPTLVELVQHFRRTTHWSMLPLRPWQKYGWGASIGFWLLAFAGSRLVLRYWPDWILVFAVTLVLFAAYGWIWPSLFSRIFDR